jgi:uncharacterized SAM-binding protein YcdF (DUF218 family)
MSNADATDEDLKDLLHRVMGVRPVRADAIVWLQGDRYDRADKVLDLYLSNFAPRIALTGNDVLVGTEPRPDETNITLGEMREWLIARGVPDSTIRIDSDSMNTREQAIHVMEMAATWRAILLVASPFHQPRAFLTFLQRAREIGWSGRIVNQPADLPWDVPPAGRTKPALDYLPEEFAKIRSYGGHLADWTEGIAYLSE